MVAAGAWQDVPLSGNDAIGCPGLSTVYDCVHLDPCTDLLPFTPRR